MKLLLGIALLTMACATTSPSYGVNVHRLKCGEKLEHYSCVDTECFLITAPMTRGYAPRKYKLYVQGDLDQHLEEFLECK